MKTKTGINSAQIKEFGGEIDAFEVEIVELGLDRLDFLLAYRCCRSTVMQREIGL